jgi:hypothetical protein
MRLIVAFAERYGRVMKTFTAPLALAVLVALPLTACRELRFAPAESDPAQPGPEPEVEPTAAPSFGQIAVARDRSCAIDDEGRVLCWGLDLLAADGGATTLAPKPVPDVEGATRVVLSDSYACAAVDAGLSCWGITPLDGLPVESQEPFLLPGSADVIDFALSPGRVCAVRASGGVRCWGSMTDPGDCLGLAAPLGAPFDVPHTTGAVMVAASGRATCFTRGDGSAACYLDAVEPEMLELPFEGVARLVVSQSEGCFSAWASFCAVTTSGAVDCVDGFSVAELGPVERIHDGSPAALELVWREPQADYCIATTGGALWCSAAPAGTVIEAERVAVARTHACGLEGGVISCWGSNEWGALGIATPSRHGEARLAAGIVGATTIAAGTDHSCATTAGGEVRCWGSNTTGQRGWEAIVVPEIHHPAWDWYLSEASSPPASVSLISPASAVFADNDRSCAAATDGSVVCWGQDLTATMSLATPTAIPDVSQVISVTTGDDSESCAVTATGAVSCWGRGWHGVRVGVETLALPAAALAVDGDTFSACALLETGEVYCWGGSVAGSIGAAGEPLSPQKVAGIEGAIDISESCVVTAGHELVCWAFPWQPGLVEGGVAVTIATGIRRVDGPCVVRDSGQAACFVELGELEPDTDALVDVPGADAALEVAAGASHACVLREDGQVACWGWAAAGRLGDGSRTIFTEPQPIVSALED